MSGVYHLPAMCHVYEVIITSWALECLLPFFKSPLEVFYICHTLARGSGYLSRYSDWLGTVRGSNPGGGEIFRTCPDRCYYYLGVHMAYIAVCSFETSVMTYQIKRCHKPEAASMNVHRNVSIASRGSVGSADTHPPLLAYFILPLHFKHCIDPLSALGGRAMLLSGTTGRGWFCTARLWKTCHLPLQSHIP